MKSSQAKSWLALQRAPAPAVPSLSAELSTHLEALCSPEALLPPKTREWIRRAAKEFRGAGSGGDWNVILGFAREPGQRSWSREIAYETRDAWLLAAWELLGADLSDQARAKQLSTEIAEFEDAYWPSWKEKNAPPAGTIPLRRALFHSFKATAGEMPYHWRRIGDVVKRARVAGAQAQAACAQAPASCDTQAPVAMMGASKAKKEAR